mmetsp:Transcript_94124/g.287966  ORF Transcript_94124/g.287966 Transcript_94124/m.287966 type:complete len:82 (-) Transcript_94124:91-336(-)
MALPGMRRDALSAGLLGMRSVYVHGVAFWGWQLAPLEAVPFCRAAVFATALHIVPALAADVHIAVAGGFAATFVRAAFCRP